MRWARQRAGEPAGTSMPGWNTARIATILLLVLAAAAIGLAVIGLTVVAAVSLGIVLLTSRVLHWGVSA